jgi:glycosyltransferase involved in cell wall biosynthesis
VSLAESLPSLLAVTSELPWPLNSGGHLRTFHLLQRLAHSYRVRLVAGAYTGEEQAAHALRKQGITTHPADLGPKWSWREPFRALASFTRGEPYVMYRRHDRAAVWAALRREVEREKPDVFYLDHLDGFVYKPLLQNVPTVLDLHNVYSTLVGRASQEQGNFLKRRYLRRETRLLERTEREAVQSVDQVFGVSEQDADHFRSVGARSVCVVPNGVDCQAYQHFPAGERQGPPLLLYIGAMSWGPNVSAARFLANEVLPQVRAIKPDACLRIVGRDPPPEVCAWATLPGVEVIGLAPDLAPHLTAGHLLAVPLEAGGGTRLKILEAFAAGLPVVSTPVGCEGLQVVDGKHLLIAERSAFVRAILTLLEAPEMAKTLTTQARELVLQNYDWSRSAELAANGIASILRTPKLSALSQR